MASTLLEFGHAEEKDVCAVCQLLYEFLKGIRETNKWEPGSDGFGPIHCSSAMRDPRDGTYSIAIQIWSEYADVLFSAMDKFFSEWSILLEYKRKDTR